MRMMISGRFKKTESPQRKLLCCLRDSIQSRFLRRTALLIACSSCAAAQEPPAKELLARALHLADLYNWADAAPVFTEAEKLFARAGDQRNTLYAGLGRIPSNIEREQQALPMVSAQLAEALEADTLIQTDKELRMFCLIAKAAIEIETNTGARGPGSEPVQRLARHS